MPGPRAPVGVTLSQHAATAADLVRGASGSFRDTKHREPRFVENDSSSDSSSDSDSDSEVSTAEDGEKMGGQDRLSRPPYQVKRDSLSGEQAEADPSTELSECGIQSSR